MRKIFALVIVFLLKVLLSFGQTVNNSIINISKIKENILPYQKISDSLYKDFDNDGKEDFVYILQTDDVQFPVKKSNKIYRDGIIVYLSKLNLLKKYNRLLPCFQCGYVQFEKDRVLNKKIEKNTFVLRYIERQSDVFIYNYYFISFILEKNEFVLSKKTRYVDLENKCTYREVLFDTEVNKLISIDDIDLMRDLFGEDCWFCDLPDKKCSQNYFVLIKKSHIYRLPSVGVSSQYLLKGDEVEVIETKDDWLKIRYYGSKTIEGWIKKTDVE